jgi:uncharacterized membrane protein YfcA
MKKLILYAAFCLASAFIGAGIGQAIDEPYAVGVFVGALSLTFYFALFQNRKP